VNLQKLKKSLKVKCQKIKLVMTDVDGVLTDGGRYYSNRGEIFKKFHVRDGMGVNLLLRNGINTVIITKEDSKVVNYWAKSMNVSKVYSGIKIKENELDKICKLHKLLPSQIAFIGDDVNDLELMKKVGFSAAPHDGVAQAKKIVNYVCKAYGGKGVLREVADIILKEKFPQKTKWY
jgi:YrbI family 3-deoxy-D-manno-octulosonate 8-phosphate phosphatase